MRRIILAAALIITAAQANAEVLFMNEGTIGQDSYRSYYLNTVAPFDPWSVGAVFSLSGSSGQDSSLLAGASLDYEFNEDFSVSAGYRYNSNTSYLVYKTLLLGYYISYRQVLSSHSLSSDFYADFSDFSISAGVNVDFNILRGYLEAQQDGKKATISREVASSGFNEYLPNIAINYDLPEDFSVNAGASKSLFSVDVKEVLDSTGTTYTANRDMAALKSAITFQDYSLSAGISKILGDFNLDLSYTYSRFYCPSSEAAPDLSHDLSFTVEYAFSESLDAGLRLDGSRSHYTDGVSYNSGYITLIVDFILGEEKDSGILEDY